MEQLPASSEAFKDSIFTADEWNEQDVWTVQDQMLLIDYGFAEANTTAGKIGIKVWICKKEDFQPRMSGNNRRERGERKERERK